MKRLIACLLAAPLAACGHPATLTEVQDEVFTPTCAFSSCHGGGAGELDLTEGNAFANLVNVEVAGVDDPGAENQDVDVTGEIRVIPGDPDDSYLVKKITGAPDIKGGPMPRGTPGLDEELVDLVVSWIEDGAQDN